VWGASRYALLARRSCGTLEGGEVPDRDTCVTWLIGRGLSIGCGLTWVVPAAWSELEREARIDRIKETLREEMNREYVDTKPIRSLLGILAAHTAPGWRHEFLTTNWDYLLQREILNLQLKVQPSWLANSHVSHLNGTIENLPDNAHRSPFLLEEDPPEQRCFTPEANAAYNRMIWRSVFVVVGMSFECATDRFLLSALSRVEDDLPIGEATWTILNPDDAALQSACDRIQAALPFARVHGVRTTLEMWLVDRMPTLQAEGAVAF